MNEASAIYYTMDESVTETVTLTLFVFRWLPEYVQRSYTGSQPFRVVSHFYRAMLAQSAVMRQ